MGEAFVAPSTGLPAIRLITGQSRGFLAETSVALLGSYRRRLSRVFNGCYRTFWGRDLGPLTGGADGLTLGDPRLSFGGDLRPESGLEYVVSVAERCGLGDPEAGLLRPAREAWARWCEQHPALDVVDDLVDFVGWTRSVSSSEANGVLAVLASLTATEPEAVTALVWALLPGAESVARKLADLHGDIDGIVAGQLWIEAAQAHRVRAAKAAAAILGQTRREVCAELGVGDLALRRDPVWTARLGADVPERLAAATQETDPEYDALELLRDAWLDDAIVSFDMWLLWDLATTAHRLSSPSHRGRMGLTSPAVVEETAREIQLSSRTLRRRATNTLDRLQEYAAAREDPQSLAEWKRAHPVVPLTAREELELAIHEERWWDLVTGEEHCSPEEASQRFWAGPERRRRA